MRKKGDAMLLPPFCSIAIEKVIRDSQIQRLDNINTKMIQLLGYADDDIATLPMGFIVTADKT